MDAIKATGKTLEFLGQLLQIDGFGDLVEDKIKDSVKKYIKKNCF